MEAPRNDTTMSYCDKVPWLPGMCNHKLCKYAFNSRIVQWNSEWSRNRKMEQPLFWLGMGRDMQRILFSNLICSIFIEISCKTVVCCRYLCISWLLGCYRPLLFTTREVVLNHGKGCVNAFRMRHLVSHTQPNFILSLFSLSFKGNLTRPLSIYAYL